MNREEILAKSRASGEDEGVSFSYSTGRRWGAAGMLAAFLLVGIFNLYHHQNLWDSIGIFWCYLAFEALGRYQVLKQKKLLISAIVAGLASVSALTVYVMQMVR